MSWLMHTQANLRNTKITQFSSNAGTPEAVVRRCSVKISLYSQEKNLCQSLFFNKVAGLTSAALLKKRLWHRCFPVKFAKFSRTLFVYRTPLVVASETLIKTCHRLYKPIKCNCF